MRLFRRFKSAWTAFLLFFSLAGVLVTYKQLSDSRNERSKKNYLGDLVQGGDLNFRQDQQGLDRPKYPEVDIMEVQALQHNIERQKHKILSLPKQEQPALDSDKYYMIRMMLWKLYPNNWGKALDADEMTMEVMELLHDLGFESPMSCKDIDSLRISASFRVGKKKFVDRAYVPSKGVELIMKSQANDLDIKVKCLQSVYDQEKCASMGNYVLLREIVWFSVLEHAGIANLLGYCIRGEQIDHTVKKKGIIILTEPGVPVMPSTFTIVKFQERLKYAHQLSELLHYLEHHPLGSLALANTYNADFVITNNMLKLVDLDDLVLGEKKCQFNSDCDIPGASQIKITCSKKGVCVDRNARLNLKIMGPLMFDQLLMNAPPKYTSEADKLRHKIISLSITNDELLEALTDLKKRYVPEPEVQQPIQQPLMNQQDQYRQREMDQQNRIQQDQVVMKDGDYERISFSNYPGKHDFQCPLSRVSWGCVVTVRSLKEAKATCNAEAKCQAFVLFTSQPDAEVLMTMVLKNTRHGIPEKNVGATLFVYKPKDEQQQRNQINVMANQVQDNKAHEELSNQIQVNKNVEELPNQVAGYLDSANQKVVQADVAECMTHNEQSTKEARKSRERRLMAHLGLKGYTEAEWVEKMKLQKIVSHDGLNDLTSSSTVGGRFNVTMIGTDKDTKLRNALYLAEAGPSQYHVAYYLVYKMDRLLGLYHTPPTTPWYMTRNEIDIVRGDDTWRQKLSMVAPNSDLKGILTTQIPDIVQPENLMIKEQKYIVPEVTTFLRQEKMQLEYVFLWYLAKIYHVKEQPFAYKGHMIQFSGDGAFQDLSIKLLPYLYNCQFPNVIYKMLACFKCHLPGKTKYSICGLGEEVIKLVENDGFPLTDFKIHQMTPKIMVQVINEAAGEMLDAVDTCIRTHSREKVLY